MFSRARNKNLDGFELLSISDARNFSHDGTAISQKHALGVPQRARQLWVGDYSSTLICFICCVGGLVAVFVTEVATRLGQVNQLIVVGVALQLMAFCTARHVRAWLLTVESLWTSSSLQNYESIISGSFTIPDSGLFIRAIILLNLITPVGLGIAYKRFTGGWTSIPPWTETGFYGMNGPPGTVGLGSTGLALFVNATATWWSNPVYYGAYGFNLNVESPNRTALLDGPSPQLVQQLQSNLSQDANIILTATVNAIVTDMVIDLTNPEHVPDLAYWYQNATAASVSAQEATDDLWYSSKNNSNVETITNYPDSLGDTELSILNWPANSSFIMTSRYNDTAGQDFGSTAQGFHTYRQKYVGQWIVTKTSVSLDHADLIPGSTLTDSATEALIEDNYVNIANNYNLMFAEFDWKNGYADLILENETAIPEPSIQQIHIKSDTTLISAAVWAIYSLVNGPSNPLYLQFASSNNLTSMNKGLRYETQYTAQLSVETLHRSWVLALILAINPLILVITLGMRLTLLRDAPVSTDFGLISLLAGIDADSLPLVRGAAYSGKLKKPIRVAFSVSTLEKDRDVLENSDSADVVQKRITATLEESRRDENYPDFSRRSRVSHGTLYG